jgi:hypothetical protein
MVPVPLEEFYHCILSAEHFSEAETNKSKLITFSCFSYKNAGMTRKYPVPYRNAQSKADKLNQFSVGWSATKFRAEKFREITEDLCEISMRFCVVKTRFHEYFLS